MRTKLWLLLLLLFPVRALQAQTPKLELEGGVSYSNLNSGFPDWRGAYIRSIFRTGSNDTWFAEVLRQSEFGETATLFSGSNIHTINENWYTFVSAGGSSSGFSFPRVRIDGEVSRKWLSRRELVTTVGLGFVDWRTDHHDATASLGAIYYFRAPLVLQGGVRWNRSSPGAVLARNQYLALTQGREGSHYISIRGEVGREAYQALGPAIVLVDFPNYDVAVTWKQWLGSDWGFNAVADYYNSDVYQRVGGSLGFFKQF